MNYQNLLKGNAFLVTRFYLCLLMLFVGTNVWGGSVHSLVKKEAENLTVQDSLIIEKNNGKRTYVILPETKIKVWTESGKIKGNFKRVENGEVVISVEGEEKRIAIKAIEKLKIKKSGIQEGLGGVLVVVGGGAVVFGGISLVAGVVAYFDGTLGVIILVAVPFLVLGGLGLYALGKLIRGKKFNLLKKWRIVRPSSVTGN